MSEPFDLVCYIQPHWRPRIRAAAHRRDWMDATREAFAYRCLPLNIANAHGWELLAGCGFEAVWNGGPEAQDVSVTADAGSDAQDLPVTLFGHGVLTFHVEGLLRTPPGWNLWLGGPPNRPKDGIAALGGVIETDWSPYTFTMNWRFTRPGQRVRFEAGEPIGFFFPLPRDLLDQVRPRIAPMQDEPELERRYLQWSASRNDFHARLADQPEVSPAQGWQKFYFRGVDTDGAPGAADHRSKLRLPEFAGSERFALPPPPAAPAKAAPARCPVAHAAADQDALAPAMVLATLQHLRALAPQAVAQAAEIRAADFLEQHYAANRPLLMSSALRDWPLLGTWTPQSLAERVGDQPLGVDRAAGMPATLAAFIAQALQPAGTPGRLPRLAATLAALPALAADLGRMEGLLSGTDPGRLWLEAAGSGLMAQQEPGNRLLLQVHGQRRLWLAPPGESARLQDAARHAPLGDLSAPDLATRVPALAGLELHAVTLQAGDALFVPYGWWRQTAVSAFSLSIERRDFCWFNPG